jgi:hypothetical protein
MLKRIQSPGPLGGLIWLEIRAKDRGILEKLGTISGEKMMGSPDLGRRGGIGCDRQKEPIARN